MFYANGTGFCDSGLKAVNFNVLPDISAFRTQDWIDFSNSSLQVIRNIVDEGQALVAAADALSSNPTDWFSIGEVDSFDIEICDPTGVFGCETISVPIYGPVLSDEFLNFVTTFGILTGSTIAQLASEIKLQGEDGQEFIITLPINSSLFSGTPTFDFDPLDYAEEIFTDIDTSSIDSILSSFVSNVRTFALKIVNPLVLIYEDFESPPGTCVNGIRHNWDAEVTLNSDGFLERDPPGIGPIKRGDGTGDVDQFQATWAYWALQNQRNLGRYEPLNWIQQIDAHNAYNSAADGFIFPNQRYSISDQLDLGVRSIELDPNEYFGFIRVCHAKDDDLGCARTDRLFDNVLKEVRNWLDDNPDEVIIIRMENYVDITNPDHKAQLLDSLEVRLGDLVYDRFNDIDDVINSDTTETGTPWPSIQEMLALDKQIIIIDYYNAEASTLLWPNPVVEESGDFFAADNPQHLCQADFRQTADPNFLQPPVDPESDKFTVMISDVDGVDDGMYQVEYSQEVSLNDTEDGRVSYFIVDDSGNPFYDSEGNKIAVPFEQKDFSSFHEIIRITESGPFLEALGGFPPAPPFENLVFIDEPKVELLRECKATLISMDFAHGRPDLSRDACDGAGLDYFECREPDQRFKAAVWSWDENDLGNNGDGALFVAAQDGRWVSRDINESHHVACASPREGDPRNWADPEGFDWRVTEGVSTWRGAGQLCLAEFGEEYVFSVPTTGWQNARLRETNSNGYDIWLNYNDIKAEGEWTINQRPVAQGAVSPSQPQPYQEADAILFTSAGSFDPEGDTLSYFWTFGDNGSGVDPTSTGPSPTHQYGDDTVFEVILNVDDGFGGVDIFRFNVSVVNVNPEVSIDNVTDETGAEIGSEVPAALIGLTVDLAGSYSDVGWQDTHQATTNWGDGSSDGPQATTSNVVSVGSDVSGLTNFDHIFSTSGTHTMTLTIQDDDDGFNAPTRDILIVDAAGAIQIVITQLDGTPGF